MRDCNKFKLIDQKICVSFKNSLDQKTFSLTYQLYDHPLIQRWLSLVKLSGFYEGNFGNVSFGGQIFDDEDFLVTTLNSIILKINLFLQQNNIPELLIDIQIEKGVSQKNLNDLHRYFEIHAHDLRLKNPLKNTFRLLNLLIHRMENYSDGKTNNCALIEISPSDWKLLPLEIEDYQLFDLNWRWGQLILNYCMLGVPTAQAFINKSIPRPQTCFSAGMYLSFVNDTQFNRFEELNKWLLENGFELNDPQAALGYIPLGIMIEPELPKDDQSKIDFLLEFKKFNQLEKIEFIGQETFIPITTLSNPPKGKY